MNKQKQPITIEGVTFGSKTEASLHYGLKPKAIAIIMSTLNRGCRESIRAGPLSFTKTPDGDIVITVLREESPKREVLKPKTVATVKLTRDEIMSRIRSQNEPSEVPVIVQRTGGNRDPLLPGLIKHRLGYCST